MLGVAVTYDRADKSGLDAAALANKISLKNNSVSSFTWTANTNVYPLEVPTVKGGLQYKGSGGDYVYGVSRSEVSMDRECGAVYDRKLAHLHDSFYQLPCLR